MDKLFVPYEIAKAVKELGFNESCFMYWRSEMDGSMQLFYHQDDHALDAIGSNNSDNARWVDCTAPLFQQVIDWLRDEHNIDVYIIPVFRDKCGYDSFKRDGYTFEIVRIEPCTYLSWSDLNQCAEDRDKEIAEDGQLVSLKPSFANYHDALLEGINHALNLLIK